MNTDLNRLLDRAKRASGATSYLFLLFFAFLVLIGAVFLYALFHVGCTDTLTPLWWARVTLGNLCACFASFFMYRFFRSASRLDNPFAPTQAALMSAACAFWTADFLFTLLLPNVGTIPVITSPVPVTLEPENGIPLTRLVYAAICFVLYQFVRYANELKADSDSII